MPYIQQFERKRYNDLINQLTESLLEKFPGENGKDYSEGDLNYIISSIIWKLFKKKRSYSNGNKLMGVLSCVQHEFYRRKISKLEDEKIKSNGDL